LSGAPCYGPSSERRRVATADRRVQRSFPDHGRPASVEHAVERLGVAALLKLFGSELGMIELLSLIPRHALDPRARVPSTRIEKVRDIERARQRLRTGGSTHVQSRSRLRSMAAATTWILATFEMALSSR
jgi:hypothetical protein